MANWNDRFSFSIGRQSFPHVYNEIKNEIEKKVKSFGDDDA